MIARSPVPRFAALLATLLVSCTSISVAPEPDLERTLSATHGPDLGFSFTQAFGELLRPESASSSGRRALDGERFATATAAFREALVDTEAVDSIATKTANDGWLGR